MQVAPMPSTTRGAGAVINLHPKENKVIYCSGKLVIIRDLDKDVESLIYKGHNDITTVAAMSPNGYYVASGDVTGKIRVWSVDHEQHSCKLETFAFSGEIKDIAWGPESKRIVAVGDGRGVMAKAFTWDTGNSIGEMVGHQKRILAVAYKPNRPFRLMTASEDFNTCLFEGPPFKFSLKMSGNHTNYVNCIRYAPDGLLAISVGSDRKMVLYDGKNGDVVDTFPIAHAGSIYSVCWSPDGTQVLTASADKTVKCWNVAERKEVQTFTFAEKAQVADMQVAVAWNEHQMISLSLYGAINVLSVDRSTKPTKVIQGHPGSILSIAGSGDQVITGSFDGTVCAWNNGVAALLSGSAHTGKISGVSLTEDEFVSVGWDDNIRFASISTQQYEKSCGLPGQPKAVAVSNNVIVVATSKGICLVKNNVIVHVTKEFSWTPTSIGIAVDGKTVAVGADDMNIHLFTVEGDELAQGNDIMGHRGEVTCVSFSPNGEYLAAGDAYREVRIWEVASQSAIIEGKWVYHTTRVTGVAWAPSGNFVASASLDEHLYIWNIEQPSNKTKFEYAHKDGATGVHFTDENTLISVGNDGCINTWNL